MKLVQANSKLQRLRICLNYFVPRVVYLDLFCISSLNETFPKFLQSIHRISHCLAETDCGLGGKVHHMSTAVTEVKRGIEFLCFKKKSSW